MNDIEKFLLERGNTHGDWKEQAKIASNIKLAMMCGRNYKNMPSYVTEGLDTIAVKIARAVSGDWTEKDHYKDIAGYATLIEKALSK